MYKYTTQIELSWYNTTYMFSCWSDNTLDNSQWACRKLFLSGVQMEPTPPPPSPMACMGGKKNQEVYWRRECGMCELLPSILPMGGVCGQSHFIKTPATPYTVCVFECMYVFVCWGGGLFWNRNKSHFLRIHTKVWLLQYDSFFFFHTSH